ncbi:MULTISPECIES: TIGR03758 family integrating conjugative element protein [unclassified Vibrio]|uniref:TIGR03758 family integrating conjugative element protein n=1 Tax=unclassified Vibrio TaxID=2614977 RepID=UPI001EFCE03F|nr:TIGR03758 family integrating conjugative element protein [Vibrio sp. Isolate22]MCG9692868.1 TIGR03758 family integrating conjugative element protein [Vibrio sp. Isolate22]
MNDPLLAFEHGAGFEANTLAWVLAGLTSVLLMLWMLWVFWSGFRGMKNKKVTKEVFRRLVFRAVFIFLILQWFLYYGVAT